LELRNFCNKSLTGISKIMASAKISGACEITKRGETLIESRKKYSVIKTK